MDLNTLIREKLKEVLLRNNAALVSKKKETTSEEARNEFGLTAKQVESIRWIRNEFGTNYAAASLYAIAKETKTAKECYEYVYYKLNDSSSGQATLGWPNLTVAVVKDVKASKAPLKSGDVIIITHGAKGHYLTEIGQADQNVVIAKDKLSYATEMEIEQAVDELNPAQLRTVLTHQYFAEFMTEAMKPTENIKPAKPADPSTKLLEAPTPTIEAEVVEEDDKSDDETSFESALDEAQSTS